MNDIITHVCLWPHGTPLPEGAAYVEGPTVSDHHRVYGSIVLLDAPRSGREADEGVRTEDTPASSARSP